MPGLPCVPAWEPVFRLLGTHSPVTLILSVQEAVRQLRFGIEQVCLGLKLHVAANELYDLKQVCWLSFPVCELRK